MAKDSENKTPEPNKDADQPVADKTPPSAEPERPSRKRQTLQMPATIKGLTPPVGSDATLIQSQDATLIQSPAPLNTPHHHGVATPGSNPPKSKSASSMSLAIPVFGRSTSRRPGVLPVERADLSDERILRDAPRVTWDNVSVPALGGIPLLAKLGQGGMGAVYFGVHPRLGSQVAVKVLPFHLADQDPTLIDRFVREAQIAAQVRSPNLVHVIDVNQDSGLWFLVMEYVSGLTGGRLLAKLRDQDKMGMTELHACEALIGACVGLQAAHSMGVIHRDIKPDNIMIPLGPDGELDYTNAKMMDLGLARRTDDSGKSGLTTTQAAMGTPGYMAPEQALEAKNADQRSDIFSMGATIYALMTGRSPFHRESPMKAIFATVHEEHPPLISVRPDLSPEFSALVDRCMAKDPAQRFPGCIPLIEELSKCRDVLAKKTGVTLKTPPPMPGGAHEATASKTHIGIGGTPKPPSQPPVAATPAPIAVQVPPKKRSPAMVFVGVMIVMALLAGGGYVMLRSGNNSKMNAQKLQAQREDHSEKIKKARDFADQGKFNSARTWLEIAQDVTKALADQSLEQNDKATEEYIAAAKKTRKDQFDTRSKHFDELVAKQELDKEPKIIEELKALAWDDETVPALITAKEQALIDFNRMKEQEKRVEDSFNLARAFTPDAALESLEQVRVLLDGSTLKTSLARPQLQKKLDALVVEMKEAKVAAEKQKADDARRAEFTRLIDSADRLVTGDISTADDAEKNLAEADKMYPGDPAVAKERDKIAALKADRKKRVEFDGILADADKLIKANKLDNADEKLKAAEKLYPDDPQIAPYLKKIGDLRDEANKLASAKEKRQRFDELIKSIDELLTSDSLQDAESKLASAEKLIPTDPALAPRKDKLTTQKAEKERLQKIATLLASVNDTLTKNGDLDAAATSLQEIDKLSPKDARIAPLSKKIADQKAENTKRKAFDALASKAEEYLAAKKLSDAATQIGEAVKLYPEDPKVKSLKQTLAAAQKAALEKERRDDFEKTVDGAVAIINSGGNLNDAEQKLKDAEKAFPGDKLIVDARAKLAAKRDEQAKRERFRSLIAEADEIMNRGGNVNDAENKTNQAAGLFPSDPAVSRLRDKINAKKSKKDDQVGEGKID